MRTHRSLVGILGAAGLFVSGCYNLPEPKVTEHAVFQAAREVIEGRYPQTAASENNGFLVALTPVKIEGSSKTRKQISVLVQRNYTGNYEPVVKVRRVVEVGTPYLGSNPETADLGAAAPLATNEWRTLDDLPYEEEDITSAIWKKLEPKGI